MQNCGMVTACIGLGSNLGDRRAHLAMACHRLATLPETTLTAFSPIYETEPVGPEGQGRYLNAAARIETALGAHTLRRHLVTIEESAGRPPLDERVHWGPRTLDLDILLFGDAMIDTDELTVPHPRMHERGFVLAPLADVAGELTHPVFKRPITDLLAALPADADRGARV